ncbi:hypothetical protein [Brochothrix phage ADU4]|uniref:Gp56 n=1 Tax=Brochothrix phage A9 TaxID=857312 RepID=D9J0K3_9CAUD|nr:gp56 [Brochothrix phage A9]ADJ53096.1 gp56 [Brochothrix phage A9]UKM96426.1 hypothetical protein [Brochothrix phage ADU4]
MIGEDLHPSCVDFIRVINLHGIRSVSAQRHSRVSTYSTTITRLPLSSP